MATHRVRAEVLGVPVRIRTIKPEFYQSEGIGSLSREVRLLAASLITWADDEGFFKASPALIVGALFPFDKDGAKFVERGLEELATAGFLELRGSIGLLPTFKSHQVISRPSPSRLREKFEDSVNTHGVLMESSVPEGKGREGNMEGKGKERAPQVLALRDAWNSHTTPPIPRWQDGRDKAALAALNRRPLEQWVEVFKRIEASPFCRGEKGWKADIDWALRPAGKKPEPAQKLLEGSFDGNGRLDLSGDWRSRVDHSKGFWGEDLPDSESPS